MDKYLWIFELRVRVDSCVAYTAVQPVHYHRQFHWNRNELLRFIMDFKKGFELLVLWFMFTIPKLQYCFSIDWHKSQKWTWRFLLRADFKVQFSYLSFFVVQSNNSMYTSWPNKHLSQFFAIYSHYSWI